MGEKVYLTMDEALAYMKKVHELVHRKNAEEPSLDGKELTIRVLKALGIPENMASPIVVTTIEAHRKASEQANILKASD